MTTQPAPGALKTETTTQIVLTGETPLVVHNPRLAAEDDPYTIEIKKLTDLKAKMTPEQREQKAYLQWRGALYEAADGALVFPARNIVAALQEAAKTLSKGTLIERGAVSIMPTEILILHRSTAAPEVGHGWHSGPADLQILGKDPLYQFRTVVNGNPSKGKRSSMVTCTRPIFSQWAMVLDVTVHHNILGWDKFTEIMDVAQHQGIGNARKLGNGRFAWKIPNGAGL
jgi:hypothetical protein